MSSSSKVFGLIYVYYYIWYIQKNLYDFWIFFRFSQARYLFVGRNKESNDKIDEFRREKNLDFYIQSSEVPGPHIIANTNLTDEEIDFAKKLFSRYSKVKGNEKVILNNSGNLEEVDVLDLKKLDEEIKKYQQL